MRVEEEPSVGGVKVRPPAALVLYGLLVLSGGAALWAQRNPAEVPPVVARAAPWVFLAFALGFAVYRFSLVVAKRYSAFKAFFQTAVMFSVFFILLAPQTVPSGAPALVPGPRASTGDLNGLLGDGDPRVRALAAELARHRPEGAAAAHGLVKALSDPDETVRGVAHESLVQLNSGQDLGPASDGAALKAWGDRFP